MLAEFGQIALIVTLLLSVIQGLAGFYGAHKMQSEWMQLAQRTALAQAILCSFAFGLLVTAFMRSDFSVALVASHSHSLKPLIYKFSGTWGNHEGSMLLWVLILTLFGAAIALFSSTLPARLRARALAVQGWVTTGFLAFLIFTSNPFARMAVIPSDGDGLNPLLQDPGLALHPPFLYLGYVGFSVAFSFAVAALIEGRVDALWARWVRPWVLAAWSFLTLGITLGSVWAYYELGWGGWWFWDPVENVSFMPWLAGTALLHSTLVAQARGGFLRWTLLLAILTFSLSLVGTFIVRSGVLTSVHAFAVDPARGVFILGLLLIYTGGALALYALRSNKIQAGTAFELQSREAGLLLNNLLLMVATATVFLGTFYPLVIDALSGDKITVGPPYYEIMFALLMTPLILVMGIGPLLKWRTDAVQRLKSILIRGALAACVFAVLVAVMGRTVFGALGFGLGLWLSIGTVQLYARKLRLGGEKSQWDTLWRRFRLLPGSAHAVALAHLGLAVSTFGIVAMGVWSHEAVDRLKLGESLTVAGYEFRLEAVRAAEGPNYKAEIGEVVIYRNDKPIARLEPEQRSYPVERNNTTEGAMDIGALRILYAAKGEGNAQDGWVLSVYYHPLVVWIWFGALMMAVGGFVSIADRQRVFLPKSGSNAQPVAAE